MKNIIKYSLIVSIISMTLVSCEKVIDLNLNTTEPRMVIEGNITSAPGPYQVKVSTSGDYYTGEGMEPITGAQITVTDNLGNTDTLIEAEAGSYLTTTLVSEIDQTYTIMVDYNDLKYTGSATLPQKVLIDSLDFEETEGFGPGAGHSDDPRYTIYCSFQDPPDIENYYRFQVLVNGEPVGGQRNFYYLTSDQLFDGNNVRHSIIGVEANPGDEVTIGLNAIDFGTYEYFRTLNDALSSGGMGSTPYNPVSNLNNNALGYFGAYAFDVKRLILE